MKHFILFVSMYCSVLAVGQQKVDYYDFYWKPCEPSLASYFSTVSKTDSGWLRHDYFIHTGNLQMQALYSDEKCTIKHGSAIYFYANGQLEAEGRFVNDKREGVYVRYHSNGMMSDSGFYINGKSTGIRYRWHRNGYMADSITRINDSMEVQVSWFENGSISAAGYWWNKELHGKWKYWHANGKLAGEEVYDKGKVISKTYYHEDGSAQPDTALANRDALFKNGGLTGWRRYLQNNVTWPKNYELTNTSQVTVGVSFSIDENGKTGDVEVYVPFHRVFDRAAEEVILKSPAWKPAIKNNRKIKSWYRQPVTFMNVD